MPTNALLTLNTGTLMPALGLGVLDRSAREKTVPSVEAAIAEGYRLIDTAAAYGNEREVGEGIKRSGIDRSKVFITTKLWMSQYGYDKALRAFDASLQRLAIDYVDLYLLHWPMPSNFEATIGAYKAAEKVLGEGRARAIGVSNFSVVHLSKLMERTGTIPAVNQIELHPLFVQTELRDAHNRLGIVTQAWSPLGGSVRRGGNSTDPLSHPTIARLARQHDKTPAQIVLRWHLDHGFSAIPKSFTKARIVENFDISSFSLTASELSEIDAMDTGTRSGPDPDRVDAGTFPITVED